MKRAYLDLNDEQREAVLHHAGSCPDPGWRGFGQDPGSDLPFIRLLDELNVSAFNLLAVTFTNKAAQEMRDRVSVLAGGTKARDLFIGTFHSLCLHILKPMRISWGTSPGFTIYDDSDQKALIKECLWELKWDEKQVHPYAVHSLYQRREERAQES